MLHRGWLTLTRLPSDIHLYQIFNALTSFFFSCCCLHYLQFFSCFPLATSVVVVVIWLSINWSPLDDHAYYEWYICNNVCDYMWCSEASFFSKEFINVFIFIFTSLQNHACAWGVEFIAKLDMHVIFSSFHGYRFSIFWWASCD